MALRLASPAFGTLYGYLSPEKRSTSDVLKFLTITSPVYAAALLYESAEKQYMTPKTVVGSLVAAPIIVGFGICVGSQLGKMARKVKEDV